MNHKILFVDLDATLLSDDKSVSQRNREAIKRMLKEGHYIALATGRSVESGRGVARELDLVVPGCYMIAFNGAVLYDCAADRILMQHSIPSRSCRSFLSGRNAPGCMPRPTIRRM